MSDDIRTPHGALTPAQTEILDAIIRGETPLPEPLRAIVWEARALYPSAQALRFAAYRGDRLAQALMTWERRHER